MEHARAGALIVVRLDRGEEVVEGLLAAIKAHGGRGAAVVTGLGAVEDVEFAYFDPQTKGYDRKTLEASHEILSLSGIVASGPDGAFQPHFHITLGGRDHRALGGHLFRARVAVLAEFVLHLLDLPAMHREKEPDFGLNALRLR